ncbi:TOMM precursor leader peptide-binding protein [Nocardiopsis sinuspersici]|uniref:TOMM precursor leader peptide-binding protein n=1 Tax=Nocardiopsis sinuspersici TaxID=501010 RepID=UPI00307D8900
MPGEGVYLVSENGTTLLRGAGVTELLTLMDGSRDRDALVRDAGASMSAEAVHTVVDRLVAAGIVCEPDTSGTKDQPGPVTAAERAYWSLAGLDAVRASSRTSRGGVEVTAVGEAGGEEALRAALRASGALAEGSATAGAELTVVLCEDYLAPGLADVDGEHRALGRPWLLSRPGGASPWIGPVFRPGEGPCWWCLEHPLRHNRPAEAYLHSALGRTGPVSGPRTGLPSVSAAAAQLTAAEALKWVAGYRHPGQNAVWTLDSLSLTGRHHEVRRRPQCGACGDTGLIAERDRSPLTFVSRVKNHWEGGDRSLTPEQLLDRYGHLVSPVTGVVRDIQRDQRGPRFLNCFHAGHNPVVGSPTLGTVRAGLRDRSSGKGTTDLQARVSALCEAVERHSGFFQGDEEVVRGDYRSLEGDAVHPDEVQLFHPRQFAERHDWNASHGAFHQVCDPFEEDQEINWTPVWSHTVRRHRLLPTSLLYYNAPTHNGRRYCWAHSNGTAAGACREEAVVQGFLELVERDAVALWWYNRLRQPGVDLASFGAPWIDELVRVHRGLGRHVWALDLTSDLGIPVMVAISRRVDKPAQDIVLGFGSHFDAGTALRRALSELNQMLPPVVEACADGSGYAPVDPDVLNWWRNATVETDAHLLPDPAEDARTPNHFPYEPRHDLREDVDVASELVRGHGMELLVLDQTRPDIGLPVVRVMVPGLRPFWARFGPGRLYDVPVRLGRLSEPTAYTDLNPVPLFM